ncbi:MAG: hypothetical protein IID15_07545, partial [Candidatus Marinimicrobia bacterium]|nr:hypothetical protein [Candidatus Neomarinimicrobiota bacterium]
MRKLKYWHLLPLLSLFIFFINSADAAGAEGEQEQIITLQETSADQLAEMKARMTSKVGFTQAQRSNPWEGRPRRTQTIRNIGDIDLRLNWLDMPAVEEGRFTRALAKTMVAAPITVTVNGAASTTLAPGDSLEIEITFSSGFTEAEATFWVDIDGDGALDESIDFDLDEGGLAVDSGTDDLNSATGVFNIILYPDEEEGFLTVTH